LRVKAALVLKRNILKVRTKNFVASADHFALYTLSKNGIGNQLS